MADGERAGRVSERVHDRLRRDILEGRLEPGDAVPSERALSERLGVNRHAVREALKRLQQAGLVRITHGGATRVLDWRDTGGLPVLLDLLDGIGGPPPADIARSIIEMRASVGIDAARLCARRAGEEARRRIRDHAEAAAALVGGDPEALDTAYAVMWSAIVQGSGNIAYRLSLNSLMEALFAFAEIADAIRPTDAEGIRALGEAIVGAEEGVAAAAARALLEPDVDRLG